MTPQEKAAHRKAARDSYIASKTAPVKPEKPVKAKAATVAEKPVKAKPAPKEEAPVEPKAPAKK